MGSGSSAPMASEARPPGTQGKTLAITAAAGETIEVTFPDAVDWSREGVVWAVAPAAGAQVTVSLAIDPRLRAGDFFTHSQSPVSANKVWLEAGPIHALKFAVATAGATLTFLSRHALAWKTV